MIFSIKWNSQAQTHTFVDTTSPQTLSGPKTFTTPIMGFYTVSSLPAAGTAGRIAIVTDGTTGGDCTIGGGAAFVWCRDSGILWNNVGGGSTLCSQAGANAYYAVAGYTPSCDASIIDSGSGTLTLNVLQTNSDGVHPAYINMIGNTTLPGVPSNNFQLLGPNTNSFTAYGLQWGATGPSVISTPLISAPSSNVSQITYHAIPASAAVIGTDSSNGPIATTPHLLVAPIQCADTSSSASAYTCTTTPSVGSLISGDAFIFSAINQNNGGTATLNVNSIGAKTIKKWQGSSNLAAGDLQAGNAVLLIYDGTNFEAQTIGNAPGTGSIGGSATVGFLPKMVSNTTTITASLCDEGVTTANTLTCTDTSGAKFASVATGTSPPTCTPGSGGAQCFGEGTAATAASSVDDIHGDSTQKALEVNNNNTGEMAISRSTCVNVTPVTVNANVTSDQNLMTCTLSANLLNVTGRTLHVHAAGIYSTAASSTAVITAKAKLCTVSGCGSGTVISLINIASAALGTVTVTNNNWDLDFYATTQTAGASAAFETHGQFLIDLGALTSTSDTVYADTNAATVSSIDSTAQLFLQITYAYSAGSTSNSVSQRQSVVEVLN